jgi:hypothetical protein
MYPANAYVIREATPADEEAVRHLAQLDNQEPLSGRVLIGEIEGEPAAAASISSGRIVSDPSRATHFLVPLIGMRVRAERTFERKPSLPLRLRAGLGYA